MANERYFATINGIPVQLIKVYYTPRDESKRMSMEKEVIVGAPKP